MHAHDRLKRKVVGECAVSERGVVRVLCKRNKPLSEPRSVPGERLQARRSEIKYRKIWLDPSPNAPLLKRIVKYPYALDSVGRSVRVPLPKGLSQREKLQVLPRAMATAMKFRGLRISGSPLKGCSLKPSRLQKVPSIELWLTEKGDL